MGNYNTQVGGSGLMKCVWAGNTRVEYRIACGGNDQFLYIYSAYYLVIFYGFRNSYRD